ncbi:hypothetical protein ACQP2F_38815 [Actinoplanes sp. CA-030573]|uniref:hypothetical protein n=1 Tax=Actinoplanes sp. CA-030573 TaxID=3239898 RepID=UPI003D8E518D
MSHIVIDLGEVPDHRATPAETPAPRPPVPWRVLLGALAVVLVALLGGAAARHRPEAPVVIPARLGDTTYLSGNRLFLVGTGGVESSTPQARTISTYRLPAARLVSRTTVSIAGAVVGVEQVGDILVVGYQIDASGSQEVVAQRAGATSGALWQRPARLIGVSGNGGVVLVSEEDGDVAIDARTGEERWRVARPVDGFIAETDSGNGYPEWLIVLTGTGALETWDAHTGRPIASTTATVGVDRINGLIWPVSNLLLVAAGHGYDGYRLPGLHRLWRTTADLSQSWLQSDCGTVICTFHQQRGMTVLDPGTGRRLWDSDRWGYAEPLGPYLLATSGQVDGGADLPSLTVLDPATGRVLGDFGAWQGLGLAPHGLIYGKRDVPGKYQVYYGLLDPANRSIEPLGRADRVSGGCEVGGGVMTCRLIDASVAVWRLR